MVSLMLDPKEWSSIEVTRRARLVNSLVLVPFKIVATSITSSACCDLTGPMAHFMLQCVFWFSWLINSEWNLHIWAEENHNHSKTHHSKDICLLIQIPQPYHLRPVHQRCRINLIRTCEKFGRFFLTASSWGQAVAVARDECLCIIQRSISGMHQPHRKAMRQRRVKTDNAFCNTTALDDRRCMTLYVWYDGLSLNGYIAARNECLCVYT